jgi:PAS domain-containing protein
MNTKIEQFNATNPNPVLDVERDGTVIYSNEAGEPLLQEWDVRVGEKLPSRIGDIVQRTLSYNKPEKIEVKVGKKVYLVGFHPFPEGELVNIYGFDISDRKELEEKLQERERKLAEAQGMAHMGNWDWNIVANKMYRSDEMQRIFGLQSST